MVMLDVNHCIPHEAGIGTEKRIEEREGEGLEEGKGILVSERALENEIHSNTYINVARLACFPSKHKLYNSMIFVTGVYAYWCLGQPYLIAPLHLIPAE